ncbi:hypothetical protein [Polaromonas sp.]|uniref:hypothetical protein n=1 Tax=Polaromonas sp. TaxID=1869339 RepID=UPI003BB60A4F
MVYEVSDCFDNYGVCIILNKVVEVGFLPAVFNPLVIPAKAGIHGFQGAGYWIPVFAGMTLFFYTWLRDVSNQVKYGFCAIGTGVSSYHFVWLKSVIWHAVCGRR